MSHEPETPPAIVEGTEVKLTRQSNGWKLDILHKGNGISGRLGPFKTLDEAVAWVQERYDVS